MEKHKYVRYILSFLMIVTPLFQGDMSHSQIDESPTCEYKEIVPMSLDKEEGLSYYPSGEPMVICSDKSDKILPAPVVIQATLRELVREQTVFMAMSRQEFRFIFGDKEQKCEPEKFCHFYPYALTEEYPGSNVVKVKILPKFKKQAFQFAAGKVKENIPVQLELGKSATFSVFGRGKNGHPKIEELAPVKIVISIAEKQKNVFVTVESIAPFMVQEERGMFSCTKTISNIGAVKNEERKKMVIEYQYPILKNGTEIAIVPQNDLQEFEVFLSSELRSHPVKN